MKELLNELNEIITKKLPNVEDKLRIARESGPLSENIPYSNAREEKYQLLERVNDIERLLINNRIRLDYLQIKKHMDDAEKDLKLFPILVSSIRDFYKRYMIGNCYSVDEVTLLYDIKSLRNHFSSECKRKEADELYCLESDIIKMTRNDHDEQVETLKKYWRTLGIWYRKHSVNNIMKDNVITLNISDIENDYYFENLVRLIHATASYFILKEHHEPVTFSHSEVDLLSYLFDFLPCKLNNAFNFTLNRLIYDICHDEFRNETIRPLSNFPIVFRDINCLKRDILMLQLQLWKVDSISESEGNIERVNHFNLLDLQDQYELNN